MNRIDMCNLEYIEAESVRQAYLKGAYRNGYQHGKLGHPMPGTLPKDTLLYDEMMKGWQDGSREDTHG